MRKLLVVIFTIVLMQNVVGQEVKETSGIVSMGKTPLTLLGNMVAIGDVAPNFTVTDNNSKPVSLSDFAGKTVIISVFPSVDTKVCAMQTRRFNKEASDLSKNVVILTVSKDLPFALGRFCAAEGIDRIYTLSDYMHSEFGYKYGFLLKENMLLARGVVVVDPKGKVVYAEYVSDIGNEPDYNKALTAAKNTLR